MAELTAYGWERRQKDGSYSLVPTTLAVSKDQARHLAIYEFGDNWLWRGDKETAFAAKWNSGEIRPATFAVTRRGRV
jgi:hypothetical protein